MHLIKSKTPEAVRKNVKAEVVAGKPVKQAVVKRNTPPPKSKK